MGGDGSRGSLSGSLPNPPPLFSSSFQSRSYIAEQAVAQDIAACSDEEEGDDDAISTTEGPSLSEAGGYARGRSQSRRPSHGEGHDMYRRFSGVAYGAARPVFNLEPPSDDQHLSPLERKQSRDAERSLLRDNHILPPKHPERYRDPSLGTRVYRKLFSTKIDHAIEPIEEVNTPAQTPQPTDRFSETSPLLQGPLTPGAESATGGILEEAWEEALAAGRIQTTWRRETKTIASYSLPLIVTFLLQYSINVVSIFAVGRIGKLELGAVSIANMTAAIVCLAPFQGLATSLDTLCAQAYGSGHKHLVGLQCQRMACFLFTLSIPVTVIWLFSEHILNLILPEAELARLASLYLQVMIFSIPGFVLFECGKRLTQAQGLFHATTYVLVAAAPINVFLSWLLVWKLELGFVGAPMAVAITENLLAIFLFLYVRFIDGLQCWGGLSKRALANWGIMIRLALPGMIMVEAEWLAFEIMTLLASRFGPTYLAAQSIITTLGAISYQIPFPVSIAASTRVANLIGAGLVDAAKTAGKVTVFITLFIGLLNLLIYVTLRFYLPVLFTDDQEVIALCAKVLPVVAIMQVIDGVSAGAHGLLRGIGKQSIGGPANLFSYYVISLPLSLVMAFGLGWKLEGLWIGVTIGLVVVSIIEYSYLLWTDWEQSAAEAAARNESG